MFQPERGAYDRLGCIFHVKGRNCYPGMLTPGAIQAMWERIYKEWLPVSDYELIPDYDIKNYLPGDPSSRDYVSEICIPVKKSR